MFYFIERVSVCVYEVINKEIDVCFIMANIASDEIVFITNAFPKNRILCKQEKQQVNDHLIVSAFDESALAGVITMMLRKTKSSNLCTRTVSLLSV